MNFNKYAKVAFAFFVISLVLFSCKNNFATQDEFLSTGNSTAISNALPLSSSPLGLNINLEDYDLKSALGPESVQEFAVDNFFFPTAPEKFTQSFNPNSFENAKEISSGEKISINVPTLSDIYYVFTNTTDQNIDIPTFLTLGAISESKVDRSAEDEDSADQSDKNNPIDIDGGDDIQGYIYKIPELPNTEDYILGPGNVDISKSILDVKNGIGKIALYYHKDYPFDFIISTKQKGPVEYRKVKSYIQENYDIFDYRSIDIKFDIGPSIGLAVGLLFTPLGLITGPIAGVLKAELGKDYNILYSMDYAQFVKMLYDGVRIPEDKIEATLVSVTGPDGIDFSSVQSDINHFSVGPNGSWLEDLNELRDGWVMNFGGYLPFCYNVSESILKNPYLCYDWTLHNRFDNIYAFLDNTYRYDNTLYHSYKGRYKNNKREVWLPDVLSGFFGKNTGIKREGGRDYIYNYAVFNFYDYYNPDDEFNSAYIADGKLGFGVYLPKKSSPYLPFNDTPWFYPIEPKDGASGWGYYLGDTFIKSAPTEYKPEEESGDVSTLKDGFNAAVIPTSLDAQSFIQNTQGRIGKNELLQPSRLILKSSSQSLRKDVGAQDENETSANPSSEGIRNTLKSPLGDYEGLVQCFVEPVSSQNDSYYKEAECKLVREVDTIFGKRYLVIYEDSSVLLHPTKDEYEKIADAFMKNGENNDIYDKLTNVFGSEWGYLNSTYLKTLPQNDGKEIPFIPKSNTITLFYTNLAGAGNSSDYIPACYIPSDIFLNTQEPFISNERLMIHSHAPKATGENLEENIIAISCEFERLIHDQYFSSELIDYIPSSLVLDNTQFSTYFFSFLAKVIASNSLKDSSIYNLPASYNLFSLPDSSFTNLFGMDKYFLYGLDRFDMLNMALTLPSSSNADYNTIAKSVISVLCYYLYTNFGSGFIQNYTLKGKEGLDGIIDAINESYNLSLTLTDIVFSLRYAMLLSSVSSLTRPNTFNYANRFKVQGVDYPSINFHNTTAYMADKAGIPSSSSSVVSHSTSSYLVYPSFKGEYKIESPILPEGLKLNVITVPKAQ